MPRLAQKYSIVDRKENNRTLPKTPESPVKTRNDSPSKIRRGSVTKLLLSPRTSKRINTKQQNENEKLDKNDNSRSYSGPACQNGAKKFQRISIDGSKNTQYDLNGRFIRKTEVKIVNNKKKIDLTYSTTSDNSSETSSQSPTLTDRFNSPIIEQTKLFLRSKLQNGVVKNVLPTKEQSKDDNSIEEVSTIASASKHLSSRATTRTDMSSFARDGHLALPCISPVGKIS